MVQNVEARFLSPPENEQLHEFQIVHAIITQCRKNAANEDNMRNNNNNHIGYDNQLDNNVNSIRKGSPPKDERSSIVSTLCRTFSALQNPSICTKQNLTTHSVYIASTVKNIISKFSRPSYHGSFCLTSPRESATPKPPRRIRVHNKVAAVSAPDPPRKVVDPPQPTTSQEAKPLNKNLENLKQTARPRRNAATPKTKSVRVRNAVKLTRHVSAPIAQPVVDNSISSGVSVRRSRSDASGYSWQRLKRVNSNVQTKVLHFEKCCQDKGQASMCAECRNHRLEQDFTPQRASSFRENYTKKHKKENFVGALSYHKPSTISQQPNLSSSVCGASSICDENLEKSSAARSTAVVCPGGTYFTSAVVKQPGTSDRHEEKLQAKEGVGDQAMSNNSGVFEHVHLSTDSTSSTQKRKHSATEEEECLVKKESKECRLTEPEKNNRDVPNSLCNNKLFLDNHVSLDKSSDTIDSQSEEDIATSSREKSNYTRKSLSVDIASEDGSPVSDSLRQVSSPECDFDILDSSGSEVWLSDELCPSPRQSYLSRHKSIEGVRRRASLKFRKIRRKLEKLIGPRPRSYPEYQVDTEAYESQEEIERRYFESLRIPAPPFMMKNKEQSDFLMHREQLMMRYQQTNWMSRLPDDVLAKIFSYQDTRSLSMLKCVCVDYEFIINKYDIRGIDSLWVKDERYLDDPCKYCRKKFTPGDVSMCRYHAKSYHCDLPYGRSYWMCCFQIEREAPGCRTGIHNNHWGTSPLEKK